jgi:hypothetical protein
MQFVKFSWDFKAGGIYLYNGEILAMILGDSQYACS